LHFVRAEDRHCLGRLAVGTGLLLQNLQAAIQGLDCSGRPIELPLSVRADKGYDCGATRRLLRALGIEPHIPKRGQREENHLGHQRWQVERTLNWLKQYRRLRIRWDRQSDIHEAFLHLACSLIVWRQRNR